jgi:hypothetical protein
MRALLSLSNKVRGEVREIRSSWSAQDSLDLLTMMALEIVWLGLVFELLAG